MCIQPHLPPRPCRVPLKAPPDPDGTPRSPNPPLQTLLASPLAATPPKDKADQEAAAAAFSEQLLWLVGQLHPTGPFGLGPEGLSLVDCAVLPFLLRLVGVLGLPTNV